MREIKFRIFDKKENEMFYSNMYQNKTSMIYGLGNFLKECSDIEEPIMQFTGLKDKNGVEIYEGDIVNFQHIDDYGYMTNVFQNGFYRGVVKWGEHYPAFDIFDIKDNSTFGFDCNIFSMESDIVIEVIGNIYQNSELLNTKG